MACAASYNLEGDTTEFEAELQQETTPNVQNVVFLDSVYDILKDLDGFTVVKCDSEHGPCLVIQHQMLHNHPPIGLISRCRILIKGQEYVVYIVLKEIESGTLINPTDVMLLCERYHPESNSYKFCPGIDKMEYQQHKEVIRFDIKSLRKSEVPLFRVDSVNCRLWYKLSKTAKIEQKKAVNVRCPSCVRLRCDLEHQARRSAAESPHKKLKRTEASSNAKLMYMSPNSQSQRRKNRKMVMGNIKRRLYAFEHTEIPLDDDQDEEMEAVVTSIERNCSDELEKLFVEGDKHGVGSKLREVWKSDKERDRKEFQEDQLRNKSGKRSNRWSSITIRLALSVYVRSPAAYEALKSFKILQLPGRSTLQAYTSAFLHEPGANNACIEDQVGQFLMHCHKRVNDGKKESCKDGVLIYDEVKVINRLMWNSRNQQLIGLSMNHTDFSSLADIFRVLENDGVQQTSYILQFIWRDLTTDFDIIGPYYTCAKSLESKYSLSCVYEKIKLFHLHGLKTSAIVCDGASSNLALIKATHGCSGVYPIDIDKEDPFEVKPFMRNPFYPSKYIYWMICPTHQLKNMINALFSSKSGGTKSFELDNVLFGWDSIVSMYSRECERARSGLTRMVPKLKEIYIIRDAWTKLNVKPAKIMQQEHVLSELYRHITENPESSESTNKTLLYLEACSNLFEHGFLSHSKVDKMNCDVILKIEKGFKFFTDWFRQILQKDKQFKISDNLQRKYLAWQTFDLLRIDMYGFTSLCESFLRKHPGYFISPLRLSGSAVEAIFSQYKHTCGGKLDAGNYYTARAAHLVKQVVASHESGKDYRDEELSTVELPLKKKQYGKISN